MNSIHLDRITIPKIGLDRLSLPRFGVPESEGLALPPELKKSLVCWYSPRKQGLTEYDVIESYATDFTNWNYISGSATVSIAANKLTITEVFNDSRIIFTNNNIFQSIDLYITGVEDGINLIYHCNTNTDEVTLHNGINRISIKNAYNYVYVKGFTGECKITIEQLPTSTAKDYSGNGHDLYLIGFRGKLNSGIGVYKEDFTTWMMRNEIEKTPFTVKKRFNSTSGGDRYIVTLKSNVSIEPFKVKVSITGISFANRIKYVYVTENGDIEVLFINNGEEVVVPKSYAISDNSKYIGFQFTESGKDDCEITITQIPDYPNWLCHIGKEHCSAYELPLLDDYTVIIKRKRIANNEVTFDSLLSKYDIYSNIPNGSFHLEQRGKTFERTQTYGAWNSIVIDDDNDIVYQTKREYNGTPLIAGTCNDGNFLEIGRRIIGCWSDFLLFDRTLTNEEINYVKYNLIDTAPAPRPDLYYDLSRKNNDSPTRSIIEDLSGNGGNAQIFNMAYALGSGYGRYAVNFNQWIRTNYIQEISSITFTANFIKNRPSVRRYICCHYSSVHVDSFRISIKSNGNLMGIIEYSYINENGIVETIKLKPNNTYTLPRSYVNLGMEEPMRRRIGFSYVENGVDEQFTITQLPSEYEGALVFDGIDDKAVISNAMKGFKTLFMEVVPMKMNSVYYDQRENITNDTFAISSDINNKTILAYNARNSGDTYINGKLNSEYHAEDLQNKRQVITIVNPSSTDVSQVFIGCNINNDFFANMALYKLIGFYDELTPEEIKKVIYKYKLNYEKL